MSVNCFDKSRYFLTDKIVKKYIEVYGSVVNNSGQA